MEDNLKLLKLNLQMFAKDGPGGEKTEPATQKKLEDARKEGKVAKSKEIVNAISLVITFFTLQLILGFIGDEFISSFKEMYSAIPNFKDKGSINVENTVEIFSSVIGDILLISAPILIVTFFLAFVLEVVQVKWKPTGKPLQPKLSKISPISGFKRVFSKQALINMLKSMAIVAICIYIVYTEIVDNYNALFNLYEVSMQNALIFAGEIVFSVATKISFLYLLIGITDYIFQKRKFKEDMKMTKQEVKEEYKMTEGDPTVKQQQRRRMREASNRRMMQKLPEADVVITNPTHYAVAIKYDADVADAPIVVAKGEDYLAKKIKEVARENDIEIVENKPLARALYASVDVGEKIPQELYKAVAEVLVFVYGVKNKEVPVKKK